MRDTRSSTAEKTRNISMGWLSLYRKKVLGGIIICIPISRRIISIRISARPHNITVIQVYVPTLDHEDEEVEQFYEQLDSNMAKIPKKDNYTCTQGDWNAKVGQMYTNTGQGQQEYLALERQTTEDGDS